MKYLMMANVGQTCSFYHFSNKHQLDTFLCYLL